MPKGFKGFQKGHRLSIGNKFALGAKWNHSNEAKKKIGNFNKGKIVSKETREKISKAHKGIKLSSEQKKKISDALKGKPKSIKGELHHCWKGGTSNDPYPIDWSITLRRSIRERDKYICQICSELQGDYAHDVHHIDYDKNNCNPDNLITLCHVCHPKTNFNREYWIKFFKVKMTSY